MPKAPAFPEDERTTLESGWEEEPSTTVEQGEVAEKVRQLQNEAARRNGMSNITSTGNSVLEEPTVDDQRANAAIAMITPPSLAVARLVVTQGNDLGQVLEISPGKSYTIGRAIDNDFVLTDIAVSRKHFDLRQEAGAWIVADRGSGNGTLVNGNLEDQPFVLANADVIEIGNTVFRFEQANAPPRPVRGARPAPVAGRYDIAPDEEEPSTVAGKPMRGDEIATPAQVAPPPPRLRPKTAPPPAPLPRLRNGAPSSAPPPMAPPPMAPPVYAAGSRPMAPPPPGLPGMPPQPGRLGEPAMPLAQLQPQSQPMPQLQPQRPLPGMRPQQPMQQPQSQPMPQLQPRPLPGMRPQQSQSMPQPLQPVSTLPMPHLARPPMAAQAPAMLAGDPMAARPSALPTTIPGQGPPAVPSHPNLPYGYPNVADMQHHGQQVLVVGNGPPRDATSTSLVPPTPFGMVPSVSAPTYAAPRLSRKTKLLFAGAGLTLLAAVATIAIMKSAGGKRADVPAAGGGGSDDEITPDEPQQQSGTTPDGEKPDGEKPDSGKTGPAQIAQKPEPAKPEPAKPEPAKTSPEPAKPEPAKPEPAKTSPEPAKTSPEPAKPEPAKPEPARTGSTRGRDPKPPPTTRPTPPPKVAVAPKANTGAARSCAADLYRQRKFSEAVAVLNQAAATVSGSEAAGLRRSASFYQQLGAAYNRASAAERGSSPASKIDAYTEWRRALNFDGSAGGELSSEIKTKIAQTAPGAAVAFVVRQDYAQAAAAVRIAEANGVSNGNTKLVRDQLEQAAKKLYKQAASEINTNPDAAKQKLRQIKSMVDGNSQTLQQANQLLGAS